MSPITVAALLLAALLVQSCASGAATVCRGEAEKAQRIRDRIENELPLRGSDAVTAYVRGFGWRLAERAGIADEARWRFAVVRDRSVNAFSIGDGRIFLTEGAILAATDEAELAGVIAHEMGHQLAGHFCPRATDAGGPAVVHPPRGASTQLGSLRQGLDPAKEREADEHALEILRDAGFDPAARSRVINRYRGAAVESRSPPAAAPGSAGRHGQAALARAQQALLAEQ